MNFCTNILEILDALETLGCHVKAENAISKYLPCGSWMAISARCWNAAECEDFVMGTPSDHLVSCQSQQENLWFRRAPIWKTPSCTVRSLSHCVLRWLRVAHCFTIFKPIAESHSQTPNSRMVCDEGPAATSFFFWAAAGIPNNFKGSGSKELIPRSYKQAHDLIKMKRL